MGFFDYVNELLAPVEVPDNALELLAAEHSNPGLKPGIHGNSGCVRCGACCICYSIEFPDGDLKKGGQVCKYLDYDFEKKIASCRVHDKGPSIRPQECIDYKYCAQGYFARTLDMWIGLRRTAQGMPGRMEKHYKKLEKQRIKQERKENKEKSKKNSKRFIFW